MADSIYYDCIEAVGTAVANLALNLNGTLAAVVIRKLPAEIDVLGNVPVIIISFSEEGEQVEPVSFEGGIDVIYSVDVNVVLPALTNTSTNIDILPSWSEDIRQLFQIAGTVELPASIYDVNIKPASPYNRVKFTNNNYDCRLLTVKLTSCESAA